jgi:hypothetical protein
MSLSSFAMQMLCEKTNDKRQVQEVNKYNYVGFRNTIRVLLAHVWAWLKLTNKQIMGNITPEASGHLLQAVSEQDQNSWDQVFSAFCLLLLNGKKL